MEVLFTVNVSFDVTFFSGVGKVRPTAVSPVGAASKEPWPLPPERQTAPRWAPTLDMLDNIVAKLFASVTYELS